MVKKLDTTIVVRLSKSEKLAWQEKSALAEIPLTTLIRQAMRKVTINSAIDQTLIAQQNIQLRRIGINLNQIAKWANTHKSSAETIEIIECLMLIEKSLKQLALQSTNTPTETGDENAT